MEETLDIRERGAAKEGRPQTSDRRLFMQFMAFGGARSPSELIQAVQGSGIEAVLYADVNDSQGIGLLSWSEEPDMFVAQLRPFLARPPFSSLTQKLEYSMLGRTYSLGHEPNLEDWLVSKPKRSVLEQGWDWAVWYPLRRKGAFSALPLEEQTSILREHGRIGHSFGEAGLAHDVRLACFGLDRNDNDFVIGLIGRELYPLSACIQAMRKTRQTSQFIEKMGPFFIGKVLWRSREPSRS